MGHDRTRDVAVLPPVSGSQRNEPHGRKRPERPAVAGSAVRSDQRPAHVRGEAVSDTGGSGGVAVQRGGHARLEAHSTGPQCLSAGAAVNWCAPRPDLRSQSRQDARGPRRGVTPTRQGEPVVKVPKRYAEIRVPPFDGLFNNRISGCNRTPSLIGDPRIRRVRGTANTETCVPALTSRGASGRTLSRSNSTIRSGNVANVEPSRCRARYSLQTATPHSRPPRSLIRMPPTVNPPCSSN